MHLMEGGWDTRSTCVQYRPQKILMCGMARVMWNNGICDKRSRITLLFL